MGTDIHGVWQKRTPQGWEDVASVYQQDRHYQLFAVLAGVRNGYGFAGILTGEPVTPIAEPRGLPADFAVIEDAHPVASLSIMTPWQQQYHTPDDELSVWMGDHSYSWLTSTEMLAWRAPRLVCCGVLYRGDYESWDRKTPPASYSGDVSGPGVIKIRDNEIEKQATPNWNFIFCEWEADLADELSYFFDEVRRLHDLHGEVRFVFGFDS